MCANISTFFLEKTRARLRIRAKNNTFVYYFGQVWIFA